MGGHFAYASINQLIPWALGCDARTSLNARPSRMYMHSAICRLAVISSEVCVGWFAWAFLCGLGRISLNVLRQSMVGEGIVYAS